MARLWDMVKTGVSGIPGTGSITTGVALPGFISFTDATVPDGTEISYGAGDNLVDGVYLTWEVGRGVYTAGVLTRAPLYSSGGGAAVNLTDSAAVWIAVLAEDLNLTIAGNTAGTTSIRLPDLTLVGGNNITLSGDGSAITIDGNAGGTGAGGTFSLYALGNTTGQSTSTSATALSFKATGNVSLGYSAGSIVVSAAGGAQTAPTLSLLAVGNTTGSTTSEAVTGSLTFSGAGGVSVGYDAGSVVISAPSSFSQSVQTLGLFAASNTTGATSSETADARSITFAGRGIVSVGYSNGSVLVSASSAQTAPSLSLYAVGNTTTSVSSGVIAAGSLSFDGAGAVSVGISGSSVVISAPIVTTAASGTAQNRSAIGNTTGSTSSDIATLTNWTISAAGGLSAGFSGGSVILSGATTAAQTAPTLSVYALAPNTVLGTSDVGAPGSLSFEGVGAAFVGVAGSSILIAVAEDQSLYALGNTTGGSSSAAASYSTMSFSGAGGVSVGFDTNSSGVLVISGPTTVASAVTMGQSALGNTTAVTSSQSRNITAEAISGAGIASVGFSNGTLVISASSLQSVQTLGLFAVGNTTTSTSSMTADARSLSFDGAGIVSVGMSGGSVVISASSAAQTAPSLSLFAVGNTTTSASSGVIGAGSLSFDGAGVVSVGISGSSVVISAPAQTAAALNLFAVGNTTTSTSSGAIAAGALSFDGAGAVSVGISGSSVVISSPATVASGTAENMVALGNTTGATSSSVLTLTALSVSGAGGLSAGFSTTGAGAGVLVLSGATTAAQTAPSLSLFAVGNTTTSVSSGVIGAGSLSFDGAGAVSVGISGSSVVISSPATVASGTAQNRGALGNTTSDSSSAAGTLSILSVSGAGGVSVGYATNSSGVLVISGATTVASAGSMGQSAVGNTTGTISSQSRTIIAETISGAGIVSVGFNAGTLVISASTAAQTGPTLSLFAVGNTTTSVSSGVIGVGSLSFDGAGAVSVGISGSSVVISSPATVASGTAQNRVALGNTTSDSSSAVGTLSVLSVSGAGGVSVGYATNSSGVLVISGVTATATSATSMGLSAVGNTTVTTSSMTQALTAEVFSGAGIASVGFNAGSIVISASSATSMGLSAAGNTTGTTSSMTQGITAEVISGAGLASVGFNAGTIVVSASDPMRSFFRPHEFDAASSVVAMPIGTFYCVPLDLQQPLSINQVNIFGSRSLAVASLTLTTVAGSLTLTASAAWNASASAALYSRVNATQFTSVTTAAMTYGMTQSFSVSRTAASNTLSITHSFGWTVGTVSSASTFSTTSTTNTSTVYQVTGFAASTGFSSMMPLDIPFATTLPQALFVMGIAQNSAAATATGNSNVTVAAGNWSHQAIMVTNSWGGFLSGPGGTARTSIAPFGWGTISAAGSSVPASIGVLLLSQTAATISKPMIQLSLGP